MRVSAQTNKINYLSLRYFSIYQFRGGLLEVGVGVSQSRFPHVPGSNPPPPQKKKKTMLQKYIATSLPQFLMVYPLCSKLDLHFSCTLCRKQCYTSRGCLAFYINQKYTKNKIRSSKLRTIVGVSVGCSLYDWSCICSHKIES